MPEAQGARTRSTRQAAAILAVLSAAPCFSSAREVHDTVRRHIEGIGIATVYRHLRMLTEHGSVDIVRGPGGEARYRLRHGGITCQITWHRPRSPSCRPRRPLPRSQVPGRARRTTSGH
jgi:Fur family transcriptional regulator, ferric uptake regulator